MLVVCCEGGGIYLHFHAIYHGGYLKTGDNCRQMSVRGVWLVRPPPDGARFRCFPLYARPSLDGAGVAVRNLSLPANSSRSWVWVEFWVAVWWLLILSMVRSYLLKKVAVSPLFLYIFVSLLFGRLREEVTKNETT